MKHTGNRILSLTLALLMLLALFAGCQKQESKPDETAQEDKSVTGTVKPTEPEDEKKDEEPASDAPSKPALSQKPSLSGKSDEEEEPDHKNEIVDLTDAELAEINAAIDYSNLGFFVCNYARPEEIPWDEVLYSGADFEEEIDDARLAEIEEELGYELFSWITMYKMDAVDEYVEEMTGIPAGWMRYPLWAFWNTLYLDDEYYLYFEHGDTNLVSVEITSGSRIGNEYWLRYTRADWDNYIDSRPFVMHCRIENGKWTFISNLPDDIVPPIELLKIEYFETKEEAQAGHQILEYFTEELTDADEPSGLCWCVLTAKTDDVYYSIDRGGLANDEISWDTFIPDHTIEYGILYEGESVAIYINRPWYPTLRISATKDGVYYGDFWVGEDNYLHLEDDVPRYIMGHDLDGEGRGAHPANEEALVNFLRDGNWCVYDDSTGEVVAVVSFVNYREMDISSAVGVFDVLLDYDRLDARPTQAPDLLVMERGVEDYASWDELPDYFGDTLGDYLMFLTQLDGMQVLVLSQANNGDGALGLMFGLGEYETEFVLYRYQGTTTEEPVG